MTYRVAIIGAGKWSENHLAGWRAQPGLSISWVVRSTQAAARQRAEAWGVPNRSADYEAVLEPDDVDIADILLPHDLHADVACLALAKGKHVVLEKPLAPTLQEGRRIAESARRSGRTVMISESWIYSTMVQKARGVLVAGEIGEPFLIRSTLDMDVRPYFRGADWKFSPQRMGGGALMDAGIHCVSACRYLLGEVREVTACMGNHGFPELRPMEDTFLLLLHFASGASGVIAITWIACRERPRTEFVVLGTRGTVEFDTHSRQFFLTTERGRCEQFEMQASRGFVEQMAHFLDCLRNGRQPITSPDEQIGSLKVVLAAYRAAASGRHVAVEEVEEE